MESDEFSDNGTIVLHGKVLEKDSDNDELIGDFEGDVIPVASIFNKEFIKIYPGIKGIDKAYARITMTLIFH